MLAVAAGMGFGVMVTLTLVHFFGTPSLNRIIRRLEEERDSEAKRANELAQELRALYTRYRIPRSGKR